VTARIAIMVEGATEAGFRPALLRFLADRVQAGQNPSVRFVTSDGRLPKGDLLRRDVLRLLSRSDAVIALTDVYAGPPPFDFDTADDAKAKMRAWVGAEPRFHPHAAQHDFEAWLLPYWPRIQRLAGSDRRPPTALPEVVNHQRPPGKLLAEVFRTGRSKRAYSKVRDAREILKDQDLAVAAFRCPELRAFLNTILSLSGADPL
jgi:hypothetical protein